MISTPPRYSVAQSAPYGNDFSTPQHCHIRSGRLVYYDLTDGRQPQLMAKTSTSDVGENGILSTSTVGVGVKAVSNSLDTTAVQFESLCVRNGNLTEGEEFQLLADLLASLKYLDPQRLGQLLSELRDYDPHYTGMSDASTVLHICQKHLKNVSVESLCALLKLFARDPRKPRQIHYAKLVEYLQRLESVKNTEVASYGAELAQQNSTKSHRGSSTAQSPQYERGDANLINLVGANLKRTRVDVDRLHQMFNIADRLHNGTLSRDQTEAVMKSVGLFIPLESVWDSILQRCSKGNGSCLHWPTIVRLIEKAQPQQQFLPTSPVGNYRRDMDSSFSYSHSPTQSEQIRTSSPISQVSTVPNSPTGQISLQSSLSELKLDLNDSVENKSISNGQTSLKLDLSQVVSPVTEVKPVANGQIANKLANLLEAIERVDQCKTGWIPVGRARQVIAAGAEFYGLKMGSKAIEAAINGSTDSTQRLVAIANLAQHLKMLNNV